MKHLGGECKEQNLASLLIDNSKISWTWKKKMGTKDESSYNFSYIFEAIQLFA